MGDLGTIEDILPLSAYLGRARPPLRFFAVPAVSIGVCFQAYQSLRPTALASGAQPVAAIAGGAGWGLVVALLLWATAWLWLRMTIRHVYLGRTNARTPIPPGVDWTHRLVAQLDASSFLGFVAGALFARPGRLVFVPQELNYPHAQGNRTIAVDETMTFTPGVKPRPSWLEVTGLPPSPRLLIRTGEGEWAFLVPDAETAARRLREVLLPEAR